MYGEIQSRFVALVATFVLAGTALADAPAAARNDDSTFAHDRKAILSMLGEYRVTFKFQETSTFDPEAKTSPRDVSRALETVKLVADEGDFISLQHILLTGDGDEQRVVKHWRQDWRYENTRLLAFRGHDHWAWEDIPSAEARGTWSQTVYQVDDSPRYSGYGRWQHIGDHSFWESHESWRPLPRREQKVRDDYDVLMGRNRQSITPYGWLHEQDNYKLDLDESGNRVVARESGHNTYRRVDDQDFSRANEYWNETEKYWAAVRTTWQALLTAESSLAIETESAEGKLYRHVFDLAEQFAHEDDAAAIAAMKRTLAGSVSGP